MPDASGDNKLHLVVAGRAWHGWQSARIRRGIEHCAGGFELGVSELWHGQDRPAAARVGDRCEVMIGTTTVITGWVDAVELGMEATTHEVQITGRDATGDLVDCSAMRKTGQWRGLRIEQIAAELAAPYGVPVRADVDTGKPLTSFALQEGETVFEAIERAARIRALLLISDGKGGLVITRAGTARVPTALVLGENMLSCKVKSDWHDRYSAYLFKGQAPGGDFFSGAAAAHVVARAADTDVTRHRPLLITNDQPDVAATLKQRAQWEANVRAARSLQVEVEVQGWRHDVGLWQPNTLVHVQALPLRLDDELLISGVEYSLEAHGTKTKLQLTRADAFRLLPTKAVDAGAGFWTLPKAGAAGSK